MIPKIIHYCWLSNDPIPEEMSNFVKGWKEKLPEYSFMLWNLNNFDINSTVWTQQAFKEKNMHLLLITLDYMLSIIMVVFIWTWMLSYLNLSLPNYSQKNTC